MCSDTFGCIRMRSDAIGCISVRWDAFGHFRKNSEFFGKFYFFLDNLSSGGVLFRDFTCNGVYFFRGVLLGACIIGLRVLGFS